MIMRLRCSCGWNLADATAPGPVSEGPTFDLTLTAREGVQVFRQYPHAEAQQVHLTYRLRCPGLVGWNGQRLRRRAAGAAGARRCPADWQITELNLARTWNRKFDPRRRTVIATLGDDLLA